MRNSVGLTRSAVILGLCFATATWFWDTCRTIPIAHAAPAAPLKRISFNRDIRPILSDRCFACHGFDPSKRKADLRLDRPQDAFGPLPDNPQKRPFVPGKPDQSEAYLRIVHADADELMPPLKSNLKLTDTEKQSIRSWIEQGAAWEEHWAFVKPNRPAPPAVKDTAWARNDIDRFILSRLEAEGLRPAPEADRPTLLRRAALDLTGVPPTPAEVAEFVADPSPNAFEKAVDRLLASPRYGERMAIDWLDYARYADSHGFQSDPERFMWRWRDWVINAFNRNMPFDQFTIEQLAGDLLPNATIDQKIATGFNRNHRINSEGGAIAEEWRIETVVDRVETTSAVWLGLTMGCARCHDHKYDPITQKEFYQFGAFFNSIAETGGVESGLIDRGANAAPVLKLPTPEHIKRLEQYTAQIAAAEATVKGPHTQPADQAKARAALDKLRKERSAFDTQIPDVMVMQELPKPRDTFVLIRGQYTQPGEKVSHGVPAILPPLPAGPPNRLTLAKWIVDPANPLTARVQANRLWEKFFGFGIVKSTENFGAQAEWPSHPELLDWLATELVRLNWDLKAFQKLIVTSATYRQSSRVTPELLERDPDNRLLARASRLRLPAEIVRDQALAASGLLVEKLGGPSVKPYQPKGIWDGNLFGNLSIYKQDKGEGLYRRSLYSFWKRTAAPPNLMLFDMSGRESCVVQRSRTNTPLQALALMNEITYVEAARVLAERMMAEGGAAPAERIAYAFRRVACRAPKENESRILLAGFQQRLTHFRANPAAATQLLTIGEAPRNIKLDPAELAAYTLTASVILNLDETVTRQ